MKEEAKSKAQLMSELKALRHELNRIQQAQADRHLGLTLASARLISLETEQIDSAIQDVLAEVGAVAHVDRACVFLLSNDNFFLSNSHEWCAPGVESQIAKLQILRSDDFSCYHDELFSGQIIHIQNISNLPEEKTCIKSLLESQGIRSLVLTALSHANSLLGFVCFVSMQSERKWRESEVSLLQVTANIIANALARTQAQQT